MEQPKYNIDERNGKNAPMAAESLQMDFSQEDMTPSDTLNRVLWKATKGDKPYPGFKK